MTDRLDPDRRSRLMQKVEGQDTKPEKIVRSLLKLVPAKELDIKEIADYRT